LLAKAFDVDSSWSFDYALNSVMNDNSPVSLVKDSWEHTDSQYPKGALHLRFSDIHEQTRAVVRYGINGAVAAQVLMLTLDGVPLFYNGMEVGDATESADPALFEKMPVFWHPGGRPPLRDIYRDLIKLRKQYAALSAGDVTWVDNTATNAVISYLRSDKSDEFLILINLTSQSATGTVDVANAKDFESVRISNQPASFDPLPSGFNIGGYGWFIYHRRIPK
jgi:glycosidase